MTANQYPHCPWGATHTEVTLADGIRSVTTGSHGGYLLTPARIAMMPECIRELRTYGALVGCYEEDKDWCLVALSFPALFDDHAIDAALATLESPLATGLKPGQTFCGPSWPEFDWSAFWASEAGREVKRRTDTYRSAMADRWQVCGYGSGGHGWTVSAKHRTTGEYASLRFDSLHGMPSGMPSGPFRIEDYAERVIARAAA